MRKHELIKENSNLWSELRNLREELDKYKKIVKITRDCYGAKLMDLEQKRLLLEHPDIVVEDIEWDPAEDYTYPERARYKFVYSIKGERQ